MPIPIELFELETVLEIDDILSELADRLLAKLDALKASGELEDSIKKGVKVVSREAQQLGLVNRLT